MDSKEYIRELTAGEIPDWCVDQIAQELDKRDKRIAELEAELDALKMKTLHPEAEQLVNRQTEAYKKLQAENKRLRSELKAAGKGAERNAHINVMLVDENKRLRDTIKTAHWALTGEEGGVALWTLAEALRGGG